MVEYGVVEKLGWDRRDERDQEQHAGDGGDPSRGAHALLLSLLTDVRTCPRSPPHIPTP